jgi:hypothetical protein
MKQNLIIALCLFALLAGSLFIRSQSSYAVFVAMGETELRSEPSADANAGTTDAGEGLSAASGDALTSGEGLSGASGDAPAEEASAARGAGGDASSDSEEERSLEDISLDKRIAAQRAKNEKTYRESGRTGSLPSEIPKPRFDINELTEIIFNTVFVYMKAHPDRFPAPADDGTIKRSFDPRIDRLLYGETRGGLIAGFTNEDLAAWDVKQLNGEYTTLILGRDGSLGAWRVLTEGDVYKLRKELVDGD